MPTNIATFNLAEFFDKESPSTASFQTDGGSASMDLLIDGDKLEYLISGVLGSVQKANDGTGRIVRSLPAAHPYYDWLYATKIDSIQGIRPTKRLIGGDFQRQKQIHMRDFVFYEKYKVKLTFEPRPYLVATDEAINGNRGPKKWWKDIEGNSEIFVDNKEYLRFFDLECKPAAEILSSPQGQFKFFRSDAAAPHDTPISNQNGGGVGILIGKQKLKFTWFFVPYEIVFSENVLSGLGKVNQYPFYGYPAGTLLFEGVEIKRYPPPAQIILADPFIRGPVGAKLCDITFVCTALIQTPRDLGGGIPDYNNAIGNFRVPFGHNLVPWPGDLKYYYSLSSAPTGAGFTPRPIYGSYPFERLFLVF
jgi:hypothetical protein